MKIDIDGDFAGQRIDKFLSGIERIGSRARAEKLLEGGFVVVDGKPALKSLRLKAGTVVEVADDQLMEPPAREYQGNEHVAVLWEDDDVLVVDKPPGLVVHPAPGHHAPTLVELLASSGVDLAESEDPVHYRPGVVHRLDKDTSGVMMLAKNHLAQRELQLALRERTARREYLALVRGHVPSRAGRIEAPIGRDVREPQKRSIDTDFPQDAITHFVVQEVLPTTTLLRLRLETGRTHQIRVHLQSIGHDVVCDSQYGAPPEFGLERQFLHAAKLSFPHPRTKEPVEVASPLPEDLRDALAEARRAQPT